MVTVGIAVVGLLSYLAYIPNIMPSQLVRLFVEFQNPVAWICAIAATVRFLFSDDLYETYAQVAMIIIDVVAGIDVAVKAVMWVLARLGTSQGTGEIVRIAGFLLIPAVLLIADALYSRHHSRGDSDKMLTVWMGAEAALIALSFILCYMNPVTNPYISYEDMGFAIFNAVTGIPEYFVPTFGNLPAWPLRMKLLLAVCVITILETYLCDVRRKGQRLVGNVIHYTACYVVTVYLMLGVFKLRTFVYHSFWYGFVELAAVVVFGLIAYLLPVVLLFPNTVKTFNSLAEEASRASRTRESSYDLQKDIERTRENLRSRRSVSSLPAVIYDENNRRLIRQSLSLDGETAIYFDEDRNEVIITGVSVYETWAGTNIGNVHWYGKEREL